MSYVNDKVLLFYIHALIFFYKSPGMVNPNPNLLGFGLLTISVAIVINMGYDTWANWEEKVKYS